MNSGLDFARLLVHLLRFYFKLSLSFVSSKSFLVFLDVMTFQLKTMCLVFQGLDEFLSCISLSRTFLKMCSLTGNFGNLSKKAELVIRRYFPWLL